MVEKSNWVSIKFSIMEDQSHESSGEMRHKSDLLAMQSTAQDSMRLVGRIRDL